MASLRFAGLLLGFLLVFQGPNYARGIKKDEVVDGISATEFGKRGQLGGRKMAVMEKELNGESQKNGESTSTSNKTTGAITYSDQKKLNSDDFVVFSADYQPPKRHPPKKNMD